MKSGKLFLWILLTGLAVALATGAGLSRAQGPEPQGDVGIQAALGSAFTYQGRLTDGGSPANGTYDFEFKLYDSAGGVGQVGSAVTVNDVTVTDGLFTVELDFGNSVFDGEARWLEVGVRAGSSSGAYTTLAPRQPLTAVPYALYSQAAPWSGLTGVPSASGDASGTYPNLTVTGLQGRAVASAAPSADQVLKWNGSQWAPAADAGGASYTAGDGLTLTGNEFSVNFAGSGSATTVARSDHDHWGQSWSGSGVGLTLASSNNDGLEVTGGSGADDDGVVINSAGGDGIYVYSVGDDGVHINSADNCGVYANGGYDIVDYGGIFNGYNGVKGYGISGYGVYGSTDSSSSYAGYFSNDDGGVDIMAAGSGIIKSEADSVLYLSPHDMVVRGSSGVDLTFRADGGVDIHSTTGGVKYLSIPVSTFGTLFGSPLYVKAIEVCYHQVGGGYIDITMVAKNNGSDGGYTSYIYNTTNRTSETYFCYSVTNSSPLVIDNSTWVQFNVNGGDHVVIHSVALTLTEMP